MRISPLLIVLLTFPLPSHAQDDPFDRSAAGIVKQLKEAGAEKKVFAVSFFTNSQGFGDHFSDYISESLGRALIQHGLTLVNRSPAGFALIRGEQGFSATEMFDAKWVSQNKKFISADFVLGGSYDVQFEDIQITVKVLNVGDARQEAVEVIKILKTPAVLEELNRTPIKQLNDVAAAIGLNHIESGKYKTEENERLLKAIESANDIKVLVVNGDNIFQTFKDEFKKFFDKPGTTMHVLLGTADSDFYLEETQMTNLKADPNDPSYIANQGKVEFNRQRLLGLANNDLARVDFRYFDTQYRLPMIIVDNKSCFLTLRLSPNESQQSVRLEFEGGAQDFAQSCLVHFNQMWKVSNPIPLKKSR
jgi:hypothetical protein